MYLLGRKSTNCDQPHVCSIKITKIHEGSGHFLKRVITRNHDIKFGVIAMSFILLPLISYIIIITLISIVNLPWFNDLQKRLDTYSTHLKVNITGENRENRVSIRNDVIIGNYNGYLKFNINNRAKR